MKKKNFLAKAVTTMSLTSALALPVATLLEAPNALAADTGTTKSDTTKYQTAKKAADGVNTSLTELTKSQTALNKAIKALAGGVNQGQDVAKLKEAVDSAKADYDKAVKAYQAAVATYNTAAKAYQGDKAKTLNSEAIDKTIKDNEAKLKDLTDNAATNAATNQDTKEVTAAYTTAETSYQKAKKLFGKQTATVANWQAKVKEYNNTLEAAQKAGFDDASKNKVKALADEVTALEKQLNADSTKEAQAALGQYKTDVQAYQKALDTYKKDTGKDVPQASPMDFDKVTEAITNYQNEVQDKVAANAKAIAANTEAMNGGGHAELTKAADAVKAQVAKIKEAVTAQTKAKEAWDQAFGVVKGNGEWLNNKEPLTTTGQAVQDITQAYLDAVKALPALITAYNNAAEGTKAEKIDPSVVPDTTTAETELGTFSTDYSDIVKFMADIDPSVTKANNDNFKAKVNDPYWTVPTGTDDVIQNTVGGGFKVSRKLASSWMIADPVNQGYNGLGFTVQQNQEPVLGNPQRPYDETDKEAILSNYKTKLPTVANSKTIKASDGEDIDFKGASTEKVFTIPSGTYYMAGYGYYRSVQADGVTYVFNSDEDPIETIKNGQYQWGHLYGQNNVWLLYYVRIPDGLITAATDLDITIKPVTAEVQPLADTSLTGDVTPPNPLEGGPVTVEPLTYPTGVKAEVPKEPETPPNTPPNNPPSETPKKPKTTNPRTTTTTTTYPRTGMESSSVWTAAGLVIVATAGGLTVYKKKRQQ